ILCSAEAINNHGDIVGGCDYPAGFRATLWRRTGEVVDLGPTLEGLSTGAADINDRGGILLGSGDSAGVRGTWIWEEGAVTEVTNLPGAGAPLFMPTGLNRRGQVAGWGVNPLDRRAVLLDRGRIDTLPLPAGAARSLANGINDRAEVIGAVEVPTGFAAAV